MLCDGYPVSLLRGGSFNQFSEKSSRIQAPKESIIDLGDVIVKMTLGEGFSGQSQFTLWSDDSEKYFCVEPVLTDPDYVNTSCGKYLKQGEELTMSFSLEMSWA